MIGTVIVRPDFGKFRQWIDALIKDPIATRKLLTRGVLELADRLRAYPPEGPYNQEPGARGNNVWYQRLFGTRWRTKKGILGGKNTSQQLQRNWNTEIQRKNDFSASVFTGVTYAPFLFDSERRASWAAYHGWKTDQEIADDYSERFIELVLEMIDDQADKQI